MQRQPCSPDVIAVLQSSTLSNREAAAVLGKTVRQVHSLRYERGIKDYPKYPRGPLPPQANRGYSYWTPSAVFCKVSGADCARCDNFRYYGVHKISGCQMPAAVEILEQTGVKLTDEAIRVATDAYAKIS